MLLIILAVVLIGIIVAMQALQGLFSAALMALVTLVCTALAFNYYEPLAAMIGRNPAIVQPAALMALLLLPLLGLRSLLDRFIRINIIPPAWLDRAGGVAFGLVTALLMVGTLMVAMQMLPFGPAVLGYEPFNENLGRAQSFWIDAPGFTIGTVETLSAGALSGGQSFDIVHPDLVFELWGIRNRPAGASMSAEANTMRVLGAYDVTDEAYGDTGRTFGQAMPEYPAADVGDVGGSRVLAIRVEVSADAADADGWWRLPGTQFRLVTADDRSYFPIGYLYHLNGWRAATPAPGEVLVVRPSAAAAGRRLTVDLLFRTGTLGNGDAVEPEYLVFRGSSADSVDEAEAGMPPAQAALTERAVTGQVALIVPDGISNRLMFIPESAEVNSDMPESFLVPGSRGEQVTLPSGVEGRVVDDAFAGGTVRGNRDMLRAGRGSQIDELWAPEGMTVVKIVGRAPESSAVQAFGQTLGQIALQPMIHLSTGESYPAVGGWVTWRETVGNQAATFIHLAYQPELAEPEIAQRLDGDLVQSFRRQVRQAEQFGLLFLVPSEALLTGVKMAGGADVIGFEAPLSMEQAQRGRRR